MNRLVFLAVALELACTKPPPPFQPQLEGFIEALSRSRLQSAQNFVTGSAQFVDAMSGGVPQGDTVEHFPTNDIGTYAWSKVVMERDEARPDGTHLVTFVSEVCMAANEQSACMRPNTFTWRALVVEQNRVWKISAATVTPKVLVR